MTKTRRPNFPSIPDLVFVGFIIKALSPPTRSLRQFYRFFQSFQGNPSTMALEDVIEPQEPLPASFGTPTTDNKSSRCLDNKKPTSERSVLSNSSSKIGSSSNKSKSQKPSKSQSPSKLAKGKRSSTAGTVKKSTHASSTSLTSPKIKNGKKLKLPSSDQLSSSDTAKLISPKPKDRVSLSDREKLLSPDPLRQSHDRMLSPSVKTPRSRKRRKSSRQISKKGVHFKKTVGVNTIPNLDSYSRIEFTKVWYMVDEYAQMEDECDQTAAFLDANRPLGLHLCSRGLEAWTTLGEQEKEWNVQEAIDSVWQAQLEQWKLAKDVSECWEFIRGEYMPISKRCYRGARTIGLKDEESIQGYISTTRSVFRSYARRTLDTHQSLGRSASYTGSMPKHSVKNSVARNCSEIISPKSNSSSSGSNVLLRSMGKLQIKPQSESFKSSLKASSVDVSESDEGKKKISKKPPYAKSPKQASRKITRTSNSDERSVALSYASTVESSLPASRRVVFKPKSKAKIPTSPVQSMCGSVADNSTVDESVTSRRMRSHMSVCSDDSTRRRMLRTAGIRPL